VSAPVNPDPTGRRRVVVAASRLWGGGLATACVAALIAAVGVLICDQVLGLELVRPAPLLPIGDSVALSYAATAFVLALVATGLAQLLALTTPRPRSFFHWIVGLATLAAVALPFALSGSTASKIATAAINLAIGVAIGSLLTAVLARTVTDPDRSWQRP
jgi:hypothetical protein